MLRRTTKLKFVQVNRTNVTYQEVDPRTDKPAFGSNNRVFSGNLYVPMSTLSQHVNAPEFLWCTLTETDPDAKAI